MGGVGLFTETALIILISYIKPLQIGLGTRAVAAPHFAIPAFSFCVVLFLYDELKKIILRKGLKKNEYGRTIYDGWVAINATW